MSKVLLIDFGSTYTKITAVDTEKEEILATARGITTIETDIMDGLNAALKNLYADIGEMKFDRVLGCSSAAGGLKMVAIGLVPELTAEAAKRAALGAGAKVLGVFCHELSEYEIEEIAELKPEIILLAGGTDGGNKDVILANANILKDLKKYDLDIPIIVAGNKTVTPRIVKQLSECFKDVIPTGNVMPKLNELDIEPARAAIRDVFLKRIVEAKGLNKANGFVDSLVMPTPAAVLKAAEVLAEGSKTEKGLGELMLLDVGGATTDVYSIAKGNPTSSNVCLQGLPEPFSKRTVEGDLGMRYSARALVDAVGLGLIAERANAAEEKVLAYVEKIESNVDYLPETEEEERIELALGFACTSAGVARHVGRMDLFYTLQGESRVQTGKDLSDIKVVIGTGGILVNSKHPVTLLEGVKATVHDANLLKPLNPRFMLDECYVASAMGLLAEEYPDTAIRMMKKYFVWR